jgi:hypothetical protein
VFFKDLKWGAGEGIRLMDFRVWVRLDFAVSGERSSVWTMLEHPLSCQGN